MSNYSIFLTERAQAEYYATLSYLSEDWSIQEALKFSGKVDDALERIKLKPKTFPIHSRSVRKFVVDKNNIIFYRIEINQIDVLSIWATKRNPKKIKL